ncbi:MAG: VOC family protein [Cyclobacteriaceae bacterium]|nr:VOC family protein [Cyclobacteriaceae bacterium]
MSFSLKNIDHISLHVADLEKSIWFYGKVLLLKQKDRPAFNFQGAWFQVGPQEIHLIAGREKPVNSHSRGTHLALEIDSIDAFRAHALPLWESIDAPKTRPDGIHQQFLSDPDGFRIELTEKGN